MTLQQNYGTMTALITKAGSCKPIFRETLAGQFWEVNAHNMHLFRLTAASCNPLATNQIIIVIMDIERILKTRENAIYYGIGEYQKTALVGLVEMLQLVLMISIYRTKIISIFI